MLRGSSWSDKVCSGALLLSGLRGLLSSSELVCCWGSRKDNWYYTVSKYVMNASVNCVDIFLFRFPVECEGTGVSSGPVLEVGEGGRS